MKILLLLFTVFVQPESDLDTLEIMNYDDYYLVITNDNSYPAIIELTTYQHDGTEIDAIDFVEAFGHAAACSEYGISHEYSFEENDLVAVSGHEYDHNCGDYLAVGEESDEELEAYYERLHGYLDPYAFLPSIIESWYAHYYKISQDGKFELLDYRTYEEIDSQISGLSLMDDFPKSQLRILRNCIFARHGYEFKSAELRNIFSQFDWYDPGSYSDDKLTDSDKEIIEYIKELERGE